MICSIQALSFSFSALLIGRSHLISDKCKKQARIEFLYWIENSCLGTCVYCNFSCDLIISMFETFGLEFCTKNNLKNFNTNPKYFLSELRILLKTRILLLAKPNFGKNREHFKISKINRGHFASKTLSDDLFSVFAI